MAQQLEKVSIIPAEQPTLPAAVTPMEMLGRAVQSGASLDMIEKLMGLQERWEANQARKAFDAAIAAAKAEIPVISKNREVDFTSPKGRTHYKYEDLAEIARIVAPILARHGLSYRFRATSNLNEPVAVTCVISHRDGHYEEITLTAGRDESGNKNSIQAVGSTLTYLQRMTLKAALGLAAAEDDDGRTSKEPEVYTPPPGSITEDQVLKLRDALEAKGANVKSFLAWAKKKRMEDIPAEHYQSCVDAIANFKKA
jgi:hypothetical protein